MRADHMDSDPAFGRDDAAIEQAALFAVADRNIQILIMFYRKARKYRVAVMPFRINRIATVGVIAPHGIGKKFIVGRIRPVFDMQRMNFVRTHHLLQANNVGADATHRFAQLG